MSATRTFVMVLTVVLLAAVPATAQFVAPGGVVPVVANNAGQEGTYWRSDVNVLNVSGEDTRIQMQLFPNTGPGGGAYEPRTSDPIDIPAGQQRAFTNVVQSVFGMPETYGTLWIYSLDGKPLVITSRTYTPGGGGTYGQDVNSVLVAANAWIAGVEHDSLYRTNVGIFWPWSQSTQFTVEVFDATGQQVGSGTVTFVDAGLQQLSLDTFGVSGLVSGWVKISASDAMSVWYAYGSTVDQKTGDAVYRVAQGHQLQ